jgi:Bacterial inner membrane protein
MTLSLMMLLHNLAHLAPATFAGALGVMANCAWPLQRERRVILALQCAGSIMFGLHYLLLGAPTAAAMCVASVVQGVSAVAISGRRLRLSIFAATIVGGLGVTIATFAGVTSVLAQTGSLLTATGRLQRSAQSIRWCFLAAEVFWTSHNLLVGSPWGLTSDTLGVTMLAIGLWRGRKQGALLPWLAPLRGAVSRAAALMHAPVALSRG